MGELESILYFGVVLASAKYLYNIQERDQYIRFAISQLKDYLDINNKEFKEVIVRNMIIAGYSPNEIMEYI